MYLLCLQFFYQPFTGTLSKIIGYFSNALVQDRERNHKHIYFLKKLIIGLIEARIAGIKNQIQFVLLAQLAKADQADIKNKVAKKTVRVLVVGNPCNTNCLIAIKNAPSLSPSQFGSLSYLDELRARALLAEKIQVDSSEVSSVVVWGNHSATLVPDITHTMVGGKNVTALVDESWIYSSFIPAVRSRGYTIIKLRGKSSSASAAWAATQAQRAFVSGGGDSGLISMGIYSQNNPYDIDNELVFSFPISMVKGGLSIDPSMKPDEKLWNEVLKSERELIEERDAVRHLFS